MLVYAVSKSGHFQVINACSMVQMNADGKRTGCGTCKCKGCGFTGAVAVYSSTCRFNLIYSVIERDVQGNIAIKT